MKTLKESLLDDIEDVIARGDDIIKDNYNRKRLKKRTRLIKKSIFL